MLVGKAQVKLSAEAVNQILQEWIEANLGLRGRVLEVDIESRYSSSPYEATITIEGGEQEKS